MGTLTGRAGALLELVHTQSGLTRAEAARRLGFGSGAAAEVVAQLVEAGLVAETPSTPTGARGRPTSVLAAHADGPVVLAAAISQESWRVVATEVGGAVVAALDGAHAGGSGPKVLTQLGGAVRRLRRRFGARVRGLGISAPGTVLSGRVLDAANLGWYELDLRAAWPRAPLFVADNDATLGALAETRRGAAVRADVALHIRVEAGLGGAITEGGRMLRGARGVAGEFGHMPFGDPAVRCPCGARGCWGTQVDGGAFARLLGDELPRDAVSYARRVLDRAARGESRELRAVRVAAAALGRGLAGLVNATDPDLVTLGGLAGPLLAIAPDALHASLRSGLMDFRRAAPPPTVPALLGDDGPLVGAAEQVWDRLWTELRA